MRNRLMTALFVIFSLLILLLPEENRLGSSYKLIYIHVPVTIITIGTLLAFPVLHFRIGDDSMKALSLSTLLFSIIHLAISSIFMLLAWGGLIFSEARYVFSVVLLLFALTHTVLCFLDKRLAKMYSFAIYLTVPYFYIRIVTSDFQLHPSFVRMPTELYIPYLFSFPLILIAYVALSRKIEEVLEN
ncbi:hypothetical protein [Geoglobus acetivorans]|uniref:Uncharacterized protein n=1 Tax=Geoglobus acetivorans TaxID=565033 RepID=A0ABZ3H626_GEOAI|nr:hypothetical protein [Geoglobus acetivorans]